MTNQAICGHCGKPLPHLDAACPACGAVPAGGRQKAPRPFVAAVLGLLPGAGHLYLGQRRKGLILLGAFCALEVLGLDLDLSVIGAAVGIPMEFGGLGLWIYSVWDAYRSAQRLSGTVPQSS